MNENEIGTCVYCQEPILENEQSLLTNALLHKGCENDIQAEIQAARGEW